MGVLRVASSQEETKVIPIKKDWDFPFYELELEIKGVRLFSRSVYFENVALMNNFASSIENLNSGKTVRVVRFERKFLHCVKGTPVEVFPVNKVTDIVVVKKKPRRKH